MKRGTTYRFSLQFGTDTESKIRAGELLERLGNKKSAVIVAALNDYLEKHPELENGTLRIKIEDQNQVRRRQLEDVIRAIVQEQLQTGALRVEAAPSKESDVLQQDIAAMLDNLNAFQQGGL